MKRTLLILLFLGVTSSGLAQSGHVLNGVGPIDQGMSGAGMASPQDALTALHWNPASIFAVPGQSLDISIQFMMPTGSLASSVEVGAFGQVPGPAGPMPFPWAALNGSTDSDAGVFPIPSIAFARSREDSRIGFGLSAFGVGGFGVDYALSPSDLQAGSLPENALLSAQQAEGGLGFGALSSTFALFQIAPTIAYRVSDQFWIGLAPTVNLASLELSVFPATSPQFFPNPADPSGQSQLALYPDAPAAWASGFGFQAGIHASMASGLSASLSYKSQQVFEEFQFSPTTVGAADYGFRLDYPAILSGAVAYAKDGLLLAADVRYIDFANTPGFDETGFDMTGAVRGFGWNSITVVALGAQYEIADGFPVRVGYSFNASPIEDEGTFFNTPAPAIVTSHLSGGASWSVSERLQISLAAQLGMSDSIEGNWKTIDPTTGNTVNIPGTSVTSELSTLTVIGGVHMTF